MTTPLSESLPQTGSFAGAETASTHAPDDMRGALPGEGPLRVNVYNAPNDTPLKVKLLRALWELFQIPFWPHTPKGLSRLRIALLKLFGAEIGPGCLINAGVRIWAPWNLSMSECSAIGANVEIQNFAPLTIGRHVVISQRNYINTSAHDPSDPRFRLVSQPITIGSQSWIASECVLGPGAQIGEGAVISAGSVVTKPMPPWMICAGNPCRPLVERIIRDPEEEERAGA